MSGADLNSFLKDQKVIYKCSGVWTIATKYVHEGYTDYFSVSDAQRLSLANERALIVLRGDRFNACVNLILALGGGWDAKPPAEGESEPAPDKGGRDASQDFGQDDILPTL